MCGVHDQGWAERAVFGKVRYMNFAGCKRKFDIQKYIARFPPLSPQQSTLQLDPKKQKKETTTSSKKKEKS
jgi:deoxyribodipyrimidine photo-lyase